jgi:hypothetical protein
VNEAAREMVGHFAEFITRRSQEWAIAAMVLSFEKSVAICRLVNRVLRSWD